VVAVARRAIFASDLAHFRELLSMYRRALIRLVLLFWALVQPLACGGKASSDSEKASAGGSTGLGGNGPVVGGSSSANQGGAAGLSMGGSSAAGMGADGGAGGSGSPTLAAALATYEDSPVDLAVDDSALYWLNAGSLNAPTVRKLAKSGGAPMTLAPSPINPTQMALDDTYVYWLADGPESGGSVGTLQRVLKIGGDVETLHKGADHPTGLAVNDTGVWWAQSGSWSCGAAQVRRTGKLNGDMTLAYGECKPWSFAASGQNIYWVSKTPGVTLRSVDQGGGAVVSEPTDRPDDQGVQVIAFGNTVFWTTVGMTSSDGALFSLRTDMPSKPVAIDTALSNPAAVATDAAYVYWVSDAPRGIHYHSLADFTADSKILIEDAQVTHLTSDGTHVYWISPSDGVSTGTIFSLPVP